MLTAESAPQTLWEPYIGHLLQPLRPLVLFGRDASLQPRCPDEHALYYSWRDTGDGKFMIFNPLSLRVQPVPTRKSFQPCGHSEIVNIAFLTPSQWAAPFNCWGDR